MYFTRDPVIETVITSREGYKLSVRNTKHLSQDPFIVEAVEVIRLGNTSFFRNCDHSKPFVVPAGDYEIMEVRDAKINLKAVGLDRGVKIAGGRDGLLKLSKIAPLGADEKDVKDIEDAPEEIAIDASAAPVAKKEKKKEFSKGEKWKEKKKSRRKNCSKELADAAGASQEVLDTVAEEALRESQEKKEDKKFSLLPPPSKLISEVLSQDIGETSANLEESLQALANESSSVIESLLSEEPVSFPEEVEELSSLFSKETSEVPFPLDEE